MYLGLSDDPTEAKQTALAAFVMSMNLWRELRARGIIDPEQAERILENVAAVSMPDVDSSLEKMMHANMRPETIANQDRIRGISR